MRHFARRATSLSLRQIHNLAKCVTSTKFQKTSFSNLNFLRKEDKNRLRKKFSWPSLPATTLVIMQQAGTKFMHSGFLSK